MALKITLYTDGVIAPLQKQLEECSNIILFGLQTLEQITKDPPEAGIIEGTIFHPMKIGDNKLNIETKKENFKNWLIKKGFEDLIKGIELSLREACTYVSIFNMPIKEINTEDDLNQYTSKIRKEVSELHIPIMIKRIENHLVNPLVYKKQILSINKGRNCLVHRNGIVSEKDINNKEEDVLKIEWIRLGFFYENGGIKEEVSGAGKMIPGGSSLALEPREELINFKKGDKIEFDYKIFNELIITCLHFGYNLISCLPNNNNPNEMISAENPNVD